MTLRWVPGWNGLTEPEAVSYVAAVEAADGQELEFGVARAINDFVLGCKTDGIWDAIKACNILAGARTTNGSLVPLVGTAPTPNNFDLVGDTDYNRVTGLKGDGSTKYLDSNRNNNADPQDNQHLAAYVGGSGTGTLIGAGLTETGTTQLIHALQRNRSTSFDLGTLIQPGFSAMSRSSEAEYILRTGSQSTTRTRASQTPYNGNLHVFRRNTITDFGWYTGRLAFYSIGESLDLEKLDNRVTRLMDLITYTQTAGLPDLATMDIDAAAYIGGGYRVGGTLS